MRDKFLKILETLVMMFWLLIILLPISALLIGSFKSDSEFYRSYPFSLPIDPNLNNYVEALKGGDILLSLITTIIIVTLSIILTSILSSLVAYTIERFEFKYKNILLVSFLLISMIPTIVLQIFVFQVLNNIHLYNSIIGVVLLYSVSDIVVIYIFKEYIKKIPTSIEKVALLNGASYFQIYWKIIFPTLKPAIMIVAIYKMIGIYNDFYIQFLYLPTKKTVSTYLYNFVDPYNMDWPTIFASVVLLTIPIIISLVLLQKRVNNNVANIINK